jgi:hypothetical protein
VTRAVRLLLLVAAAVPAGCMSHFERVTATRTPLATRVGSPINGATWTRADVWFDHGALVVRLSRAALCRRAEDVRVTRRDTMQIRASKGRYAGVVALAAVAAGFFDVAASSHHSSTAAVGAGFAGLATVVWGVPLLGERDETLSQTSHVEARELGPAPCTLRPLAAVRVTLRAGGRTLQRQSDARGVATFDGVTSARGIELFAGDRAIRDVAVQHPGHTQQ